MGMMSLLDCLALVMMLFCQATSRMTPFLLRETSPAGKGHHLFVGLENGIDSAYIIHGLCSVLVDGHKDAIHVFHVGQQVIYQDFQLGISFGYSSLIIIMPSNPPRGWLATKIKRPFRGRCSLPFTSRRYIKDFDGSSGKIHILLISMVIKNGIIHKIYPEDAGQKSVNEARNPTS